MNDQTIRVYVSRDDGSHGTAVPSGVPTAGALAQDMPDYAKGAKKEERRRDMNDWVKKIHANAMEHGWWEEDRSFAEVVALCHSELSEALEADRAGEPMVWHKNDGKPEGAAVELMDCVIRILDWFGYANINAEEVLKDKHEYNITRPYKHGKKY